MFHLSGRTLLSVAAEYGHDEVVKLLLEAEADPNLKDRIDPNLTKSMEGYTKGRWLFGYQWESINEFPQGRTPLFRAVCRSHYDTVKILIDAGAEVNVVDSNGLSPLGFVRRWHCSQMKRLLERKSSDGVVGKHGDNNGT